MKGSYEKGLKMQSAIRYKEAAGMLPPFSQRLFEVPARIAENACEIRLRAGKPPVVETLVERYVCQGKTATTDDIFSCIRYFCDFSLYSCERELSQGFITLKGGHRAGFTGTAFIRNGKIENIRDISSINLRIAAEHKGIAERLLSLTAFEQDFCGLAILGPPLSAKTTMLRDYCRLLSAFRKTAVVDERSEIAAVYNGVPQNDMGANCDVLNGFPKPEGIRQALRSLSPEYIFCDELGEEYGELADCSNNGVKLIITAHCGSMAQASRNRALRLLADCGAVNYAVLLDSGRNTGRIIGLWRIENGEAFGCCGSNNNLYGCGNGVILGA